MNIWKKFYNPDLGLEKNDYLRVFIVDGSHVTKIAEYRGDEYWSDKKVNIWYLLKPGISHVRIKLQVFNEGAGELWKIDNINIW